MIKKPCLKGVPGCGCSKKCGHKTGEICCCAFTCAAICVTIEGGCQDEEAGSNVCSCNELSFVYLLYDAATHSYHGTLGCGDISVDLEFKIVYCSETEECYLCLLSDCLSESAGTGTQGTGSLLPSGSAFDGDCDNLVSCKLLSSSNEACIGTKGNDNDLLGGIEHEWEVNIANCGDSDCTGFKLTTMCTDRIFPKEFTKVLGTGSGTGTTEVECGCTDCFCLCKDLCISYFGTECSDGNKVSINSSGIWTFEVFGCDPEENGRTIEIKLNKNESTGKCELVVTTPLAGTGSTEQETVIELTNCPDIPLTRIYVDEGSDQYFEFECWKCQGCTAQYCVCECDTAIIQGEKPGFLLPDSLTLEYEYNNLSFAESGGTGPQTITLEARPNDHQSGPCRWIGRLTVDCTTSLGSFSGTYVFELELGFFTFTSPRCGWALRIEEPLGGSGGCPGVALTGIDVTDWDEYTCACDPVNITFYREVEGSGGTSTFAATITE